MTVKVLIQLAISIYCTHACIVCTFYSKVFLKIGVWAVYGLVSSCLYEDVSKSFRTGCLEWELQMLLFCATRCSCIAILWVSLTSFVAITLCVTSQWVFIIIVYFIIDSIWKLLDTPLYVVLSWCHLFVLTLLTFSMGKSHICDRAQIAHPHASQCKTLT